MMYLSLDEIALPKRQYIDTLTERGHRVGDKIYFPGRGFIVPIENNNFIRVGEAYSYGKDYYYTYINEAAFSDYVEGEPPINHADSPFSIDDPYAYFYYGYSPVEKDFKPDDLIKCSSCLSHWFSKTYIIQELIREAPPAAEEVHPEMALGFFKLVLMFYAPSPAIEVVISTMKERQLYPFNEERIKPSGGISWLN